MRILAIDHGSKRIGIAVSDELKMIAQPLEFIPAAPFPAFLARLNELINVKEVELILIGMPGIEKRLARYPQLYSRIGFAHQYRPLADDELAFVLTRRWQKLGLALDLTDFTDAPAVDTTAAPPALTILSPFMRARR